MRNKLIEQSEKWLRLIVESAKDFAIFTMDVDGRVSSWNPGAQAMFGYPEKEIVGQHVAIIFTPEDREKHLPEKELAMAARVGSAPDERWHLRKDGSRFYVSGVMRIMQDEEGKLRGFTKIARDLTERKTHEEELQRAHDELEKKVAERTARLQETVQELEAFSYSVSHDMRAPLRAIIGFGQLILEDHGASLGAEEKSYLDRMVAAAHRLDRLVVDILTYSRVSRSPLELHPVDLQKIIQEAIHDNPEYQPPRAEIEIQSPLPIVVGHEASLMQCVSNLLSNAVKFRLPSVIPRLRIWSEPRGEFVRIWFEDNGIGIAPKDVNRIFSLFGRLHPMTQFEGTGIGLTIVRKAVHRMDGKVGVESEPDKGSRFWIDLKPALAETPLQSTLAETPLQHP